VWVNRRYNASAIPSDSHDVAAVLLKLQERSLLLIAAYEARNGTTEADREADLAIRLQAITASTQQARQVAGNKLLDVLICTDFNRHHELWGGFQAQAQIWRRNEGEQVVDFMQEAGLHSLLPRGTTTWEHQSRDLSSTVDVVLGSEEIQEKLEYCRIHNTDYGSDHKPIAISFRAEVPDKGP
jgi:exonuclease III